MDQKKNDKWSVIIIGHTQMANLVTEQEYDEISKGREQLLEISALYKRSGEHKYISVARFFNTKTDVCLDPCDISSISISKIEDKEGDSGSIPLFG